MHICCYISLQSCLQPAPVAMVGAHIITEHKGQKAVAFLHHGFAPSDRALTNSKHAAAAQPPGAATRLLSRLPAAWPVANALQGGGYSRCRHRGALGGGGEPSYVGWAPSLRTPRTVRSKQASPAQARTLRRGCSRAFPRLGLWLPLCRAVTTVAAATVARLAARRRALVVSKSLSL